MNRWQTRAALVGLILLVAGLGSTAHAQTIAYGETTTGTLDAPGDTESYTFSGVAGDVILVRLAEQTNILEPRLRLLSPGGSELQDVQSYTMAMIDAYELPSTGTYTLWVGDINGDEAGDFALHLQRLDQPVDATALALDDVHHVSLPLPAQTAAFTFTGSTGDRMLFRLNRVTASVSPQLRLYDDEGVLLDTNSGNPVAELSPFVLPASGSYTLLVADSPGTGAGDLRLYSQKLNAPVGAVTMTMGQTLVGTFDDLAEADAYRFTATAGQRYLVRCAEITSAVELDLRVYDAAGDLVTSVLSYNLAELDELALPGAGLHTLVVTEMNGDELGDYALHLQCTSSPALATALVLGQSHGGTVPQHAATAAYTLGAVADARYLLRLSREAQLSPELRVYTPSGTLLASNAGSPTAMLSELATTITGDHTVLVMHSGGVGQGTYRVHAQRVDQPSGATAIGYGSSVAGNWPEVSLTRAYTFAGIAGQRILVRVAEVTGGVEPGLFLYDDDGTLVASSLDYTLAELNGHELATTGTHTLLAYEMNGDETGDFAVHLQCTSVPQGAGGLVLGASTAGDVTLAADSQTFLVGLTAGDRLLLRMNRAESGLAPEVRVYGPTGEMLSQLSGNPVADLDAFTAPATGQYAVFALDSSVGQGAFQLFSQRLNNPVGATSMSPGQTLTGAFGQLAEADAYRFSAPADTRILVRLSDVTAALETELRLYDAAGTRLQRVQSYTLATLDGYLLPSAGTYTVMAMEMNGDETGDYALHLQFTSQPADATPLAFGDVHPGSLTLAAASQAFVFDGQAGQRVFFQEGRLASTLAPAIKLYDPAGEEVAANASNPLARIDAFELPSTGTYALLAMDSAGSGHGDFNLFAQSTSEPEQAVAIASMTARTDTLTAVAEAFTYTFAGGGGDSVTVTMSEIDTSIEPALRLYGPDGDLIHDAVSYTTCELACRLPASGTYTLLAMDMNGDETGAFALNTTAIAIGVPDTSPGTTFRLHGNRPNPFNPRTTIGFDLPRAGTATLCIYALDGRLVRRLLVSDLSAGRHAVTWTGRDDAGRAVASGGYVCVLKAGAHTATQRMMLVR